LKNWRCLARHADGRRPALPDVDAIDRPCATGCAVRRARIDTGGRRRLRAGSPTTDRDLPRRFGRRSHRMYA
jgi:hypothetical protein